MKAAPVTKRILPILLAAACGFSVANAQEILPQGARVTPLVRVAFTEGPVWRNDGSVFFSDIENNRIMRVMPDGKHIVFRTPSGKANGLLFDRQARLVACEGGNRCVTRTDEHGNIDVLADQFDGMRFNSPNDITSDSKGHLFFTDPRYGDRSSVEMVDQEGNEVEGVYRIDPDGSVERVLSHEVKRPNGIAVSPDDKFLFVADNANDDAGKARCLWRFELDGDRNVVADSQKKLFDWGDDRGPDGMAIDQDSNLYVTAGLNYAAPPHETSGKYKAGVYVISAEGKLLETIAVPMDMITNCAFGGSDRKTLYITAGHKLWSIPVQRTGHTVLPME